MIWRFLLVLLILPVRAGEFDVGENGLIYNETTMTLLREAVAREQARFEACPVNPPANPDVFSELQATAHFVIWKGDERETERLEEAMLKGASFEDIKAQYGEGVKRIYEDRPVLRVEGLDWDDTPMVTFRATGLDFRTVFYKRDLWYRQRNTAGKWVIFSKTWEYGLEAAWFTTSFESKPLPERWARMVTYANCMIDPNATIITRPTARKTDAEQKLFAKLVNLPKRPSLDDFPMEDDFLKYDYRAYYKVSEAWEEAFRSEIYALTSDQEEVAALIDAVAIEGPSFMDPETFEILFSEFLSPAARLALKRSYEMVGGCSQDTRPRQHAIQIAHLAAETAEWDIFLRAHLNVMNDFFSRVSDGSYAYGVRKTYIRELEALNLDTPGLLLGTVLLVRDETVNRYIGSLSRLGRAFSNSDEPEVFEATVLDMVDDPELDLVNRSRCLWVYITYLGHLEDKQEAAFKFSNLEEMAEQWPGSLSLTVAMNASYFNKAL